MSGIDPATLDERLRAVERAVTDADRPPSDLADAAELTDRTAAVESRLEDLEARVAELEAASQALRGYVGSVRSVNREVEECSEAALATARSVERRLDAAGIATAPAGDGDDFAAGVTTDDPAASPDDAARSSEDGNRDGAAGGRRWPGPAPAGPDDPLTSGRTTGSHDSSEDCEGIGSGRTDGEAAGNREPPAETGASPREDGPATDPSPASGRTTTPPAPPTPPVSGPERSDGSGPPVEGPTFEADGETDPGDDPAWPSDDPPVETPGEWGSTAGGESWPPGDRMDVERTEPWSIPDPPEVEEANGDDPDGGLFDRLRGAL